MMKIIHELLDLRILKCLTQGALEHLTDTRLMIWHPPGGSITSLHVDLLPWALTHPPLIPSGNLLRNYGKIHPFLMGKLTISMAIFNSYVKLPEGN